MVTLCNKYLQHLLMFFNKNLLQNGCLAIMGKELGKQVMDLPIQSCTIAFTYYYLLLVGNKIIINLKVCGCQLENKLLTYLFQISNSEPRSAKKSTKKMSRFSSSRS